MLSGFAAAVALLAQVAGGAGELAPSDLPSRQAPPSAADRGFASAPHPASACPEPANDSRTIVICTERPQGYRLNPDLLEARREMKSGGRPTRPGGTTRPDCASVGPAPCFSGGINLVAAALTAAEMGKRLVKGQEVGSMFLTDPHPSEYQLYLMAKARREAREAEQAAAAKAKTAARPSQATAAATGAPSSTIAQPQAPQSPN